MERIDFSLDRKSFQKASFRKYRNELKLNKDLQKGGVVVLLFVLGVFILRYFITSSIFQYFSILVSVLFILFVFVIIFGNYSTWKEGGEDYDKIFGKKKKLLFAYDYDHFVYGSFFHNERYSWKSISSLFILRDLNIAIIEDKDGDQFYLKLSSGQMENLQRIVSDKKISVKDI